MYVFDFIFETQALLDISFQGKRARLSKETVESEDETAQFLDETASTRKCQDCGPGHPLASCPQEKPGDVPESSIDTVRLNFL